MGTHSTPITNAANANIGITNIVEEKDVCSTMMQTFTELANKLKAHCGPYSGTAILTNPNDPIAEPIFTKDGINIVRRIKYASPMQDFVRRQLAYMGARIEHSAGDGTTSSMIIMAYTLSSLLRFISDNSNIARYSGNELLKVWTTLVDNITEVYADYRKECALITNPDTIEYIAASQAYTSSHGDTTLAKCIGSLFRNTPKEVWDTLTICSASYESEEKYKVTVNNAEYTLDNAVMFPNDRCNKELGTVLELEHASFIIQDTVCIGDPYQKEFHEYVKECIQTGKQLLVICSNNMDGATRSTYEELFNENPKHQVVFILVPSDDAMLNDVTALSVLVYGKMLMEEQVDEGAMKIFNADIRMEGSTFRFTNGLLVGDSKNGVNPYYRNPDHPKYNEFVDHIRRVIEREKADVSSNNSRRVMSFIRILHKLITTRDVVFMVGGQAYDNAAARDVAMDALLAAKCSLTKGFVAGRCVTLQSVLKDLSYQPIFFSKKLDTLYREYISSLMDAINVVHSALADSLGSDECTRKALTYKDAPADFTRLDDPSYVVPPNLHTAIAEKKDYCIIQPIETDLTFLKRFGELGLKFLTANRVIMDGYFYDNSGSEHV